MDRANGSFNNWPMSGRFGYFATYVDRGGEHTMLAEARAVANADPTWLGYLASTCSAAQRPSKCARVQRCVSVASRARQQAHRGSSSDPAALVRAIETPSNGTYYAIVNTAMTTKRCANHDRRRGSDHRPRHRRGRRAPRDARLRARTARLAPRQHRADRRRCFDVRRFDRGPGFIGSATRPRPWIATHRARSLTRRARPAPR